MIRSSFVHNLSPYALPTNIQTLILVAEYQFSKGTRVTSEACKSLIPLSFPFTVSPGPVTILITNLLDLDCYVNLSRLDK